ncbi:hypothetical protein GCM10027360_48300 [Amycolatopsis echigonensis]
MLGMSSETGSDFGIAADEADGTLEAGAAVVEPTEHPASSAASATDVAASVFLIICPPIRLSLAAVKQPGPAD